MKSKLGIKKVWLITFAVLAALGTAWSLATPFAAAPDEGDNLVRAAAVVRGQLTGVTEPGRKSLYVSVTAPETYAAAITAPVCFVFNVNAPAGCEPPFPRSTRPVTADLYVGRYPPLYYAIVGVPTLLVTNPLGLYAARFLNLLLSDVFLATAFVLVLCLARSRLLLAGLLVAMTPEVLYLSGVLNTSSLEVSAALCLWSALVVLIFHCPTSPPRYVVGWIGVSAVGLTVARPISPLWTLIALGCLTPLAWKRMSLATLFRRWDVRGATAAVGLSAAGSVAWTFVEHATRTMTTQRPPPGASWLTVLRGAIGESTDYIHQAVGLFGLDARSPEIVVLFWILCVGALLLLAYGCTMARGRLTLGVVVVAAAAVPTLTVALAARQHGFIGFGRYFLPIYAGVPIVAGALAQTVADERRMLRALVVLVASGEIVAYYWTLHRYLVGDRGPVSPAAHVAGVWHPPLPGVVLDLAMVVLIVVAGVLLLGYTERYEPSPQLTPVERPGLAGNLVPREPGGPCPSGGAQSQA
ncbi:MAG TPA: DUF2142 domain-containing protein [Acidimicrobiales bacterium]|jgi:hypothetical protein|nr:DUF2142 domain-containing protein [Acidimicrobiales bacterium]